MLQDEISLQTKWQILERGQCSYRSGGTREKQTCTHLIALLSECSMENCPLVQPNYLSFDRDETTLLLIRKTGKNPAEMWQEEEIEGEDEEIRNRIENELQNLPHRLQHAARTRYQHIQRIINEIVAGLAEEDVFEEEVEDFE